MATDHCTESLCPLIGLRTDFQLDHLSLHCDLCIYTSDHSQINFQCSKASIMWPT